MMASAATVIQRQLTEALAQFREAFIIFDRTNDGTVDAREFCDAMENVFGNADRDAALEMVSEFDITGDGEINFAEFVGMMTFGGDKAKKEGRKPLNQMLKAQLVGFREVCRDVLTGVWFSKDTIVPTLCYHVLYSPPFAIDLLPMQAFGLFDKDNDGIVSLDDFTETIKYLRIPCTDQQIQQAFLHADEDESGKIHPAFLCRLPAVRSVYDGIFLYDDTFLYDDIFLYYTCRGD